MLENDGKVSVLAFVISLRDLWGRLLSRKYREKVWTIRE